MERLEKIFLALLFSIKVLFKIVLVVLGIILTVIFSLMGSKQVVNFFPKNSKR